MKKIKKMSAAFLAAVMLISSLAVGASAYAWTDTFQVYKNQGAKLSNAVPKWNFDNFFKMELKKGSSWYEGEEMIHARARDTGNNWASNLVSTKYAGTFKPSYLSGHGAWGYSYKLAVQYDDDNPYDYAYVTVNWEP